MSTGFTVVLQMISASSIVFYIFCDRIPKVLNFTLTPSPQSPAPTLIFPVLLQYYSSSKAVISSPFCYLSVS